MFVDNMAVDKMSAHKMTADRMSFEEKDMLPFNLKFIKCFDY